MLKTIALQARLRPVLAARKAVASVAVPTTTKCSILAPSATKWDQNTHATRGYCMVSSPHVARDKSWSRTIVPFTTLSSSPSAGDVGEQQRRPGIDDGRNRQMRNFSGGQQRKTDGDRKRNEGTDYTRSKNNQHLSLRDGEESKMKEEQKQQLLRKLKQPNRDVGGVTTTVLSNIGARIDTVQQCCSRDEIVSSSLNELSLAVKDIVFDITTFLAKDKKHGTVLKENRPEISFLLERILEIYGQLAVAAAASTNNHRSDQAVTAKKIFHQSLGLFKVMSDVWTFNLQRSHYESVILAAVSAECWQEAAALFTTSIDPEDNGFTPATVDVRYPLGLLAIAKSAQEGLSHNNQEGLNTAVIDEVMDAVLKMTMVSSDDRDKYILAAGTAIGLAGECEAFLKYRNKGDNASELGQSLTAAVMNACLLCGKGDVAWQIYKETTMGHESLLADEWHWGGGQEKILPLCKELAMRACADGDMPCASVGLKLLREAKEDGVPVSLDSLCAVVQACSREGLWKEAMVIFKSVLQGESSVIIPSNELNLFLPDSPVTSPEKTNLMPLLNAVMRTCNLNGQHGVSMLAFRLFQLSYAPFEHATTIDDLDQKSYASMIAPTLLPTITKNFDEESKKLLLNTIVALCGLSCPNVGAELFEMVESLVKGNDLTGEPRDLYEYCQREIQAKHVDSLYPNTWETAARQIHRVTGVFYALTRDNGGKASLTTEEQMILSVALAHAVKACTAVNQGETGIQLVQQIVKIPTKYGDARPIVDLGPKESRPFRLTDYLASSITEAYASTGDHKNAIMFLSTVQKESDSSDWSLSHLVAINSLFAMGRPNEALKLFQSEVEKTRTPDLFAATARGLAGVDNWKGILDLYKDAVMSSCLSEELTILAMKAINFRRDSSLPIRRNIIKEYSNLIGVSPIEWLEANYWNLQGHFSQNLLSLLMYWVDPDTRHLDEMEFALKNFETRLKAGLTPKKKALLCILRGAQTFSPGYIPEHKTELPRLPRDREDWVNVIIRVTQVAENAALLKDSNFVENVSKAFFALEEYDRGMAVVHDALERGVQVRSEFVAEAYQ